jgi:hypothetical protein
MTGTLRVEHADFMQWLMLNENRYTRLFYNTEGRPIADARCKIALRFLADPEARWLFMLDSDQWPCRGSGGQPFHNPLDFIERDLDVIGFPYPTVRYSHPDGPIIWLPHEPMPDVDMAATNAIATGGVLIARRVLEHPALRVPFADVFNPDGTRDYSEDIDFSKKAVAAGFTLHMAMNRPLCHVKPIELVALWRALHQDSQPPQADDSRSLPKAEVARAASAGRN